MRRLFFLFLLYQLGLSEVWSQTFIVDNLKYSVVQSEDFSVRVSFPDSMNSDGALMLDSLFIPAFVEHGGHSYRVLEVEEEGFCGCDDVRFVSVGKGIRRIGNRAFRNCLGLESVQIPCSVEMIGECIFSGCINLSSIMVEEGNPVYDSRETCNAIVKSDGDILVAGCKETRIPSSVTNIGSKAFHRQHVLRHIEIPEGVKCISYKAFEDCSQMATVSLPESLKEISGDAFKGCESLKSIYIPKGVESIEYNPFTHCPSLLEIEVDKKNKSYHSGSSNSIIDTKTGMLISGCSKTFIHSSVSKIEMFAFQGASRLSEIFIPHHVTKIEAGAFADCSNLVLISVDKKNALYNDGDGGNCIIEKLTGTLVCGGCATKIPSNVQTIGVMAFRGIETPATLIIPENVKTIKRTAFFGCDNLKHLIVEGSPVIHVQAFAGCKQLENVILGEGMEQIPPAAFANCTSLKDVHIPETVKEIAVDAFYGCQFVPYKKRTREIFKSQLINISGQTDQRRATEKR